MDDIFYAVNDAKKQAIELGKVDDGFVGVKATATEEEMLYFVLRRLSLRGIPPPQHLGAYLRDPIFNPFNLQRFARALFALDIQRVTCTDYNPAQFEVGDYTLVASLHRWDDRIGKTLYQRQEMGLRRSAFLR